MTYYHASPTGGLQILEPRKSPYFDKPTQVCLTSLRAMALFYLIRNYEYAYGYTRQGKLYFDDPFPNALKKLYAGKSGWLYICEDGDYKKTEIPNEFVSAQPVRITGAEYIPDAYEAFLREQAAGNIQLLDYAHFASDPEKFDKSAHGWKKPSPKKFGKRRSGKPRIPTARTIIRRTIRKSGQRLRKPY